MQTTAAAKTVLDAIGNTPLIELKSLHPANGCRIMAKLESANPTGSMKDRMARSVIESAAAKGYIRPGNTVIEYTAGTTGISLGFVCASLGYRFHAVFSDAFSHEKRITMRSFGSIITDVQSDNKKITSDLIRAMIAKAGELSKEPGHWWADQLKNEDAERGYYDLGKEIWDQTNGNIDAFVHSVGTAHSIHGVTRQLWSYNKNIHVAAIEPAESAVISGRPTGSHKIEGMGLGFIVPFWKPELVNEVIPVSTEEAMTMARKLAKDEGIFAGTSTGANLVGALRLAERSTRPKTIVTLIVDSGLRYISTPLYADV